MEVGKFQPDLVILAGFMRILGPAFVRRFPDRILNIHPALLPRYKGTDTHRRVLQAGDSEHGASVHVVTEELDAGPVVQQVRVPVMPDDDEETLARRVLNQEHRLYPAAIARYWNALTLDAHENATPKAYPQLQTAHKQ
jgi:phosphoribosylglycinamide formyltransferase-1